MKKLDRKNLFEAFEKTTWGNSTDTPELWVAVLQGEDAVSKKRLFSRLFMELPDATALRSFFEEDQIRAFLRDFTTPLHYDFQERRRKIWRLKYKIVGPKEKVLLE